MWVQYFRNVFANNHARQTTHYPTVLKALKKLNSRAPIFHSQFIFFNLTYQKIWEKLNTFFRQVAENGVKVALNGYLNGLKRSIVKMMLQPRIYRTVSLVTLTEALEFSSWMKTF